VFDIAIGNPPYVRQEELKNVTVIGSDGKPRPLKEALKDQYECYTGTADLYVYFFERSLQLLRTGGVLSFITSNKYFRAGYGERLRAYLAYATNPRVILDFGDAPVFTSIAYPAILVTQKTRHIKKGQLPASAGPTGILHPSNLPPEAWRSRVLTWSPGPALNDFPEIFDQQASALAQRDLKPDGWRLESPVKLRLLERLRTAGTPLGEYVQGRFYRGILTGLMAACFEQWLNGLVYELFFPDELHARNLKLFDETARLNPPDLATIAESDKPTALLKLFDKVQDADSTLRSMLFDLRSLDVVRLIEETLDAKAASPIGEETC